MVAEKYKKLSEKYNDKHLDNILNLYANLSQYKPIPNGYVPDIKNYCSTPFHIPDRASCRLGYIHRLVLFEMNMKKKDFLAALRDIQDICDKDHLNILWEDIYRDTLRVMGDAIWNLSNE